LSESVTRFEKALGLVPETGPYLKRKDKMAETLKCHSGGMKGRHHSEETKKKMSLVRTGSKSYNWQDGLSKLPYSQGWTEVLKKAIRKRDNYVCQLCGKTQKQEGLKLSVHHINYNKEDCNPTNLITLCKSCNSKVNKCRSRWTEFFQLKLKIA